jgi:hypothetical protein
MHKRTSVKSGKGMPPGYARVSIREEQSNAMPAKALRAAGRRRIYMKIALTGNIFYHSNPLACYRKNSLIVLGNKDSSDLRN